MYANKILNSNVLPLINRHIIDSPEVNPLQVGKNYINEIARASFLRGLKVNTGTETLNNFVKISLIENPVLNGKTRLRLEKLKSAIDPQKEIVFKVWFDGADTSFEYLKIESIESRRLTLGQHQWAVQSMIVEKSLKTSFLNAIENYRVQKYNLQKQLESEYDDEKRQVIQGLILKTDSKIYSLKTVFSESLMPVGDILTLNFEVVEQ